MLNWPSWHFSSNLGTCVHRLILPPVSCMWSVVLSCCGYILHLSSVALFNILLACLVFNASSCAFIISLAPASDISSVALGTYLNHVDIIMIDKTR